MVNRIPTTFSVQTFCQVRQLDVKGFAFILSMMISLNPIVAGYYVPQTVIWGLILIWIAAAFVSFCHDSTRGKRGRGDGAFCSIARLFLVPKLLIWFYGVALFALGIASSRYASTGLTQLLSIFLPLSALYLFGRKTVDYVFWATSISLIPQIYLTCAVDGFDAPVQWLSSLVNDAVVNPFENHEITFTAAFLFVYYSSIDRFGADKDALKVIICAIMLLLGFKRILVLSVSLTILLALICGGVGTRRATKLLRFSSVTILVGCWLFLAMIYNGTFFDITESLGINTMGRNYYYAQIAQVTDFSPGFLGLGLNAVSNMLSTTYSYMHVGGVHSDILKYYAEIGFVGFALWSWFYLLKLPKMIERRLGDGSAYGLRIINILAFVTYFTDNIDIYFGSQLLYVAIPITFAMMSALTHDGANSVHGGFFDSANRAIPSRVLRANKFVAIWQSHYSHLFKSSQVYAYGRLMLTDNVSVGMGIRSERYVRSRS